MTNNQQSWQEKQEEREKMKEEGFNKILVFCRFHPRSHYEIKDKLYAMGLWKREVEEILSRLIENNHVSEERFADHFASKRFNTNNWGREKIKQRLIQQRVSEYNIKHVLKNIDDNEYKEKLYELARKKWDSIKGLEIEPFIRARKTSNYLLRKGYEARLVFETIKKLKAGEL